MIEDNLMRKIRDLADCSIPTTEIITTIIPITTDRLQGVSIAR